MKTFKYRNERMNLDFYGYLGEEVSATLKKPEYEINDFIKTEEKILEIGFYRTDCPKKALQRALSNHWPFEAWTDILKGFKRVL